MLSMRRNHPDSDSSTACSHFLWSRIFSCEIKSFVEPSESVDSGSKCTIYIPKSSRCDFDLRPSESVTPWLHSCLMSVHVDASSYANLLTGIAFRESVCNTS